MSTENGAYRWWENYLVRYLMPSIAGAVIVSWLVQIGGESLRALLLLKVESDGLQAPTLFLLFLYGNLFCYVASYPILGFHVTRVIDFSNNSWKPNPLDGYVATLILAALVLIINTTLLNKSCLGKALPFVIAGIFSGIQLWRIVIALQRVSVDGLNQKSSKVFSYAFVLARRRGIVEELRISKQTTPDQHDEETGERFNEETEHHKRSIWRKEFIDTYRHMREHGNSAFIFILELSLAGLVHLVLYAFATDTAVEKLAAVGVILAIWALPAIFVHFIGQHIERRFSWYDRKLK